MINDKKTSQGKTPAEAIESIDLERGRVSLSGWIKIKQNEWKRAREAQAVEERAVQETQVVAAPPS